MLTSRFLKISFCLLLFGSSFLDLSIMAAEVSNSQELTLDVAVYRVLTQALTLRVSTKDAQSNYGRWEQAKLPPNPTFNYEVENFAGNNTWKGWDNREERYFYAQLFETVGKRRLRSQAASYQYYASLVGYDVTKLIVLNRLHRAFIAVVANQELLQLALDQAEMAKDVLHIAAKKVQAGKVSLIQQNKAEVAYSTTLVAVEKAKTDLKISKRRLSLLWSSSCPDFTTVIFPFYAVEAPQPLEQSLAALCNQAEVIQSLYQYLNAEKIWTLEKANSVPNVTLQVGYKANYEENNQGMIAGISVPLPFFNRNQGGIGAAYYTMLKTGDQGRELWLLLESRLAIAHEEVLRAYEAATYLKNHALLSASQAFELAQKGYKEGKFEYLDVLDAQRTLFDVKAAFIQTLVNYHTRQADIDFLNSQVD